MPTPSPPERQQALAALATLSVRELEEFWRRLDLGRPDRLAEPLAVVVADIVDRYGAAAASLAADWYDEAREEARARGVFTAAVAASPAQDRIEALTRWGIAPLFGTSPSSPAALTRVSGGMQRVVLNQARDTTAASVALDPAKPRFARHASANACAFCRLLATNGPIYRSESSALHVVGRGTDTSTNATRTKGRKAKGIHARGSRTLGEKYHDDCRCAAIEVFDQDAYKEAPYVAEWRQTYNDVKVTAGKYDAVDLKATLAEMRKTLGTH